MKNTVTILRERLFSIIRRLGKEPERYTRKPGMDFTRKRTLSPRRADPSHSRHGRKEHLERAARAFPQANRYAVGVGFRPAAAEAASVRARRSVSPVLGLAPPAKEVPGLPAAGCGRFIPEIRSIPCE